MRKERFSILKLFPVRFVFCTSIKYTYECVYVCMHMYVYPYPLTINTIYLQIYNAIGLNCDFCFYAIALHRENSHTYVRVCVCEREDFIGFFVSCYGIPIVCVAVLVAIDV